MTRTTASVARKKHRSKIHQLAKGFRGRSKNCYRVAVEKVEKALQYAYRDRRTKKRNFRSLWIQRINAAVRAHDINYSEFINLLTKKNMEIDRKILSDIAVKNPELFAEIVNQAKAS